LFVISILSHDDKSGDQADDSKLTPSKRLQFSWNDLIGQQFFVTSNAASTAAHTGKKLLRGRISYKTAAEVKNDFKYLRYIT
jgi:hypothetical protein